MNIIITGVSKRIGYAIIKAFSKLNQNSNIIAFSRDETKLNEIKIESEKINTNCKIIPFKNDFLNQFNNQRIKEVINTHFKKVDILINNAGYLEQKPFLDFDKKTAIELFQINFFGAANLIKTSIPFMNNPSHVVNIGSMGGYQGSSKFPGLSYYSASKAALANLTECLAEEFKNEGISFNCLCLGAVQTEMLSKAFPGYKAPLNANEIAKFISEFAINGHKYFNGKILPISVSTP